MNDKTTITFLSWGGGDKGTPISIEVSYKEIATEFVKAIGFYMNKGKVEFGEAQIREIMTRILNQISYNLHPKYPNIDRERQFDDKDIESFINMTKMMGYIDIKGNFEEGSLVYFLSDDGKQYYKELCTITE